MIFISHLLRSVCYFHCSSAEEWSSSHIFWGAFITFTVPQQRNDLHHIFWGAFVTFTVPQRRNDLHHIFWGAFVTFTNCEILTSDPFNNSHWLSTARVLHYGLCKRAVIAHGAWVMCTYPNREHQKHKHCTLQSRSDSSRQTSIYFWRTWEQYQTVYTCTHICSISYMLTAACCGCIGSGSVSRAIPPYSAMINVFGLGRIDLLHCCCSK